MESKTGILSTRGAECLGEAENTRVTYTLHPKSATMAMNIRRESDNVFIGDYLSVGDDGIIET